MIRIGLSVAAFWLLYLLFGHEFTIVTSLAVISGTLLHENRYNLWKMSKNNKKDRFFDVEVVNKTKKNRKTIKIDSSKSKTAKNK